MRNYLVVNEDNVIENIIVCDSDIVATDIGAVPYYDGATIGEAYSPPPPPPTQLDQIQAQVTYTALKTGTLINQGGIK